MQTSGYSNRHRNVITNQNSHQPNEEALDVCSGVDATLIYTCSRLTDVVGMDRGHRNVEISKGGCNRPQ